MSLQIIRNERITCFFLCICILLTQFFKYDLSYIYKCISINMKFRKRYFKSKILTKDNWPRLWSDGRLAEGLQCLYFLHSRHEWRTPSRQGSWDGHAPHTLCVGSTTWRPRSGCPFTTNQMGTLKWSRAPIRAKKLAAGMSGCPAQVACTPGVYRCPEAVGQEHASPKTLGFPSASLLHGLLATEWGKYCWATGTRSEHLDTPVRPGGEWSLYQGKLVIWLCP